MEDDGDDDGGYSILHFLEPIGVSKLLQSVFFKQVFVVLFLSAAVVVVALTSCCPVCDCVLHSEVEKQLPPLYGKKSSRSLTET
ncbi:hypothetical protein L1987_16922 [Smallanthus sonchifolius]|uniref:Uncharacterized protein n=1 Tax=Smallanthus sonchifolius TaxID=185202 RepID=A0ACB9IXH0_9ASTR|nr:hypothetical protein L1987_16922 [Smallanthus sonchifolius]